MDDHKAFGLNLPTALSYYSSSHLTSRHHLLLHDPHLSLIMSLAPSTAFFPSPLLFPLNSPYYYLAPQSSSIRCLKLRTQEKNKKTVFVRQLFVGSSSSGSSRFLLHKMVEGCGWEWPTNVEMVAVDEFDELSWLGGQGLCLLSHLLEMEQSKTVLLQLLY